MQFKKNKKQKNIENLKVEILPWDYLCVLVHSEKQDVVNFAENSHQMQSVNSPL